jgi:hypothetical protein
VDTARCSAYPAASFQARPCGPARLPAPPGRTAPANPASPPPVPPPPQPGASARRHGGMQLHAALPGRLRPHATKVWPGGGRQPMTSEPSTGASADLHANPNARPQQQEMPLAMVLGQPVLQIPQDLYIPPDALEVILDAFEGPLDLLLYLIRRQNLDILDIPVASITRQYVDYIQGMHELRFELAAEYLVMAAILAEIKSRLLLPRPPSEEGDRGRPARRPGPPPAGVRTLQEGGRRPRHPAPAGTRHRPGACLRARSRGDPPAAAGGHPRDAAGPARRVQARRAVHPARDQARCAQRPPAHGRTAGAPRRWPVPPLRIAVHRRGRQARRGGDLPRPAGPWPRNNCSTSSRKDQPHRST